MPKAVFSDWRARAGFSATTLRWSCGAGGTVVVEQAAAWDDVATGEAQDRRVIGSRFRVRGGVVAAYERHDDGLAAALAAAGLDAGTPSSGHDVSVTVEHAGGPAGAVVSRLPRTLEVRERHSPAGCLPPAGSDDLGGEVSHSPVVSADPSDPRWGGVVQPTCSGPAPFEVRLKAATDLAPFQPSPRCLIVGGQQDGSRLRVVAHAPDEGRDHRIHDCCRVRVDQPVVTERLVVAPHGREVEFRQRLPLLPRRRVRKIQVVAFDQTVLDVRVCQLREHLHGHGGLANTRPSADEDDVTPAHAGSIAGVRLPTPVGRRSGSRLSSLTGEASTRPRGRPRSVCAARSASDTQERTFWSDSSSVRVAVRSAALPRGVQAVPTGWHRTVEEDGSIARHRHALQAVARTPSPGPAEAYGR